MSLDVNVIDLAMSSVTVTLWAFATGGADTARRCSALAASLDNPVSVLAIR